MTKFWRWKNQAGTPGGDRTLYLNGAIAEESWFDDDVTPQLFKNELMSGSGNVTLWINSPGGDCVVAAQIYNMLMDYHGDVTVKIDGIAASAASVIAMAGTKVMMSPVSMMMIHNPATLASGDSREMEKAAEMLNEVKESIINAYEIKTGLSRAKLSRLMDAETWMDARSAVKLGFADEIITRDGEELSAEEEAAEAEEEAAESEEKSEEEDLDEDEETENMFLFSRARVTNSLMDKLKTAVRKNTCRAPQTEERKVDELYKRLDAVKNHI